MLIIIDKNGKQEIIIGSDEWFNKTINSGKVFVFKYNAEGQLENFNENWPVDIGAGANLTSVGDINKDENLNIVVSNVPNRNYSNSKINALNLQGENIANWPINNMPAIIIGSL